MASALSPQIRILAGGEHRILTDIGRVDPIEPGQLPRPRRLRRPRARHHEAVAGGDDRRDRGRRPPWSWRLRLPDRRQVARGPRNGGRPQDRGRQPDGAPTRARSAIARWPRATRTSWSRACSSPPTRSAPARRSSRCVATGRRPSSGSRPRSARRPRRTSAGYLVLGTDTSVQLSVWEGSGAYVAGEETALISALSGDRGMPLIRPPYPADKGPVGRADGGPERRDAGARGVDHGPLAGRLRVGRQRGQPRHEARHGHGPRRRAGPARGPVRHARCSTCSAWPAAAPARPRRSSSAARAAARSTPDRWTWRTTTTRWRRPARSSAPARCSSPIQRTCMVATRALLHRLQRARGVRQGGPVPHRHASGSSRRSTGSWPPRRDRTTSSSCASCRAR